MALDPITAAVEIGRMAIRRIWPDPEKQAEEERKLLELADKGNERELNAHVEIMLKQIEVNRESAKHKSLFVSGARPAVIWVGVICFVWSGVLHPLLMWIWAFASMEGEPPPMIDTAFIGGIVSSLLGVAGMRSFDKQKGTQTDSLGKQ